MGNFRNIGNLCPICNGGKERCSVQNENTDDVLYHCRSGIEHPNFKNLGLSGIGFFMYKPIELCYKGGRRRSNDSGSNYQLITDEERLEAIRKREEERIAKEKYEKSRIENQLSAQERHVEYTKMLNSMILTDIDKAHLNGIRGFLHDQIDRNGYRTVTKYETVSSSISPKTPGVFRAYDGSMKINYGGAGILIPARDIEGNIIAFQIRNTETPKQKNKNSEKFGKYVWSGYPKNMQTEAERKLEFYPSAHLQNGELPLHIANPHNFKSVETIYLAEGILKPDITAYRFEQVVIGSPGGSWYKSPEQLLNALKHFNTKNIVLCADAGSIINRNMLIMYNRVRQLLEYKGFDFKVAWWGQVTKSKNTFNENTPEYLDIDELDKFHPGFGYAKPQFNKIEYLTWDQFVDTAFSEKVVEKRPQLPYNAPANNFIKENELRENYQQLLDREKAEKAEKAQKYTKSASQNTTQTTSQATGRDVDQNTDQQNIEFDDFGFGEEFEYGNEKSNFKKDENQNELENKPGNNTKNEEENNAENTNKNNIVYTDFEEIKKFNTWKKRIEYTSTEEFNTPYVSINHKIQANSLYFINSGLGTGKTWWALEMLKTMNSPFLYITFRNSLCEQFIEQCEKRGIECFHGNGDDNGFRYQNDADSLQGLAFCIDSLHKISARNLVGKIIIFDEAFSTIQEMLSKTNLKKNRVKILNFFKEAVSKCGAAIFMDGHLTDAITNYVEELAPQKTSIKYKNNFKGRKFDITFVNGSYDEITKDYYTEEEINNGISERGEKIKIKVRDRSPILQSMYNSLGNICVATDSLNQSMSLHQRFKDQGRWGIIANSISYRENWLLCEADPESSVQNFIKDVDGFIEKYKPEYVIYTPTAEAGIDISIHKKLPGYFSHQYCLFFNVIGTFGQSQMIARLRDPDCPRTVWLYPHPMGGNYEYTGCGTSDYRNIYLSKQKAYINQIRKDAQLTGIEKSEFEIIQEAGNRLLQSGDLEKDHSMLAAELKLKLNYEKSEPRKCLIKILENSGHKVSEVSLLESKQALELNKEASDNFKKEESENIAIAEVLESKEYEKESTKINISRTTRFNLEKTALNFLIPGITEKTVWDADFVYHCKYGDRNFLRGQNRFYLFNNKEALIKNELSKHRNNVAYAIFNNNYESAISDVETQYTKIRLLQDQSNIAWFLDPNIEWQVKNEWFDNFDGENFKNIDNDPIAQKVFDFLIFFNKNHVIFDKQYPIKKTTKGKQPASAATKQIVKIIEWLGLKVKSKRKAGKSIYFIDPQCLGNYHQACQECLAEKYSNNQTKQQSIAPTIIEKGLQEFGLITEKTPERKYVYNTPYEAFKALESVIQNPYTVYEVLKNTSPEIVQSLITAPNSWYSIQTCKYLEDVVAWGNENLSPKDKIILPQQKSTIPIV